MNPYSYNTEYLQTLSDRWTKVSFPIISGLVAKSLAAYSPKCILDFGCGAGVYAGPLASRGAEVSGCDISATCIESSRNKYSTTTQIEHPADIPPDYYDMIFTTEVLEHIEDYKGTIREFHRVLREQGTVVLTTTSYSPSIFTMLYQAKNTEVGLAAMLRATTNWVAGFFSLKQRDKFIRRWCFQPLGGHYHGFFKSEMKHAFKAAGFRIISCKAFYAMEPIQMPFLYSYSLRQIIHKREWTWSKRLLATLTYLAAHVLNRLMKSTHIFANNFYIIAQKQSDPRKP